MTRSEAIESAARALLDKLYAAGKAVDFAIQIATLHHCPYTGPTYGEEMEQLAQAFQLPPDPAPNEPTGQTFTEPDALIEAMLAPKMPEPWYRPTSLNCPDCERAPNGEICEICPLCKARLRQPPTGPSLHNPNFIGYFEQIQAGIWKEVEVSRAGDKDVIKFYTKPRPSAAPVAAQGEAVAELELRCVDLAAQVAGLQCRLEDACDHYPIIKILVEDGKLSKYWWNSPALPDGEFVLCLDPSEAALPSEQERSAQQDAARYRWLAKRGYLMQFAPQHEHDLTIAESIDQAMRLEEITK